MKWLVAGLAVAVLHMQPVSAGTLTGDYGLKVNERSFICFMSMIAYMEPFGDRRNGASPGSA